MRKIRSHQIPGISVQEVLDEFNERASEFGVFQESDIISVSALPATRAIQVLTATGAVPAKVEVVITYWANE